jgi:hypothetical protein
MKRLVIAFFVFLIFSTGQQAYSQCSVCTRTAQQLGDKPARGLNAGIIYLAFAPLAIIGVVAFRFFKRNPA